MAELTTQPLLVKFDGAKMKGPKQAWSTRTNDRVRVRAIVDALMEQPDIMLTTKPFLFLVDLTKEKLNDLVASGEDIIQFIKECYCIAGNHRLASIREVMKNA